MVNQSLTKPFLRWAGSKRQLIPVLSSYWNKSYARYVEPFMGSACLFFAIQPARALLSDLNSDLVKTFKIVKTQPNKLGTCLSKMSLGRDEYYFLRQQSTHDLDKVDAAARFIYLNRYCFNGLFRTNRSGCFNVPYGGGRTGQLPSIEQLCIISELLQRSSLKCGDFESVLDYTTNGDFVYLDPPFAVANRRVFRQYGPQNFGLEDLHRLSSAISEIDCRGVKFVLSYAYCSEAIKIFKRWQNKKVFVRRNIAGFSEKRKFAAELIVSNII